MIPRAECESLGRSLERVKSTAITLNDSALADSAREVDETLAG